MPRVTAPDTFDIAFIGSGIACSMTLLELSQHLLNSPQPSAKLRIAVVERHEQFWSGIPYGPRTSMRSLAIQKFDEFVNEPEKAAYTAWLERNKQQWLASFSTQGGAAAARWLDDNRAALEANDWGEIYLPRYLFGTFIAEQVTTAIAELSERELAEVVTIHAEAISAVREGGHHLIGLEPVGVGPTAIMADKVIVAIGSPPPKTIMVGAAEPPFAYINDIYSPSQEANLDRVRKALERIDSREARNVLVVGSNASSIEALYLICHDASIRGLVRSITVVSRSGTLPYMICEQPPAYEFHCLTGLLAKESVTAEDLIAAIRADLEGAEELSLNLADLYTAICALVWQVLAAMDLAQEEEFHCAHGMTFTKLVRRAGRDCRRASEDLITDGALTLLAGEVLSVQAGDAAERFATLRYRADGGEHLHPEPFAVVVNCGGFEELDACSSQFLAGSMANGLARPNRTNRGLLVNDDFEASPGFYVIGPLIGGNFTANLRYWHVESAPRIRSLAKSLAAKLACSLRRKTFAGDP